MDKDRRRHPRYGIEIPVELRAGADFRTFMTGDVSFRGLFVQTDHAPRDQQLVEVRALLPPDDASFQALGMCVFTVPPGGSAPAGAGILLYAVGDGERRKWDGFIRELQNQAEAQEAEAELEVLDDDSNAEHGAWPLEADEIQLRPASLEHLLQFGNVDLEKGCTVLPEACEGPRGTLLHVHVIHPETGGVFELMGRIEDTPEPGRPPWLQLSEVDDDVREQFNRFVYVGFTEIELEDVIEVDVPEGS
jgi:hypothetical protein